MQHILQQDTQRIFQDWGIHAFLEEVSHYYDPETGQLEESGSTTELMVLIGSQTSISMKSTLVNAHQQQITVLVNSADLDENFDLTSARILLQNIRYKIQSITTSQLPGLVALDCLNEQNYQPQETVSG